MIPTPTSIIIASIIISGAILYSSKKDSSPKAKIHLDEDLRPELTIDKDLIIDVVTNPENIKTIQKYFYDKQIIIDAENPEWVLADLDGDFITISYKMKHRDESAELIFGKDEIGRFSVNTNPVIYLNWKE